MGQQEIRVNTMLTPQRSENYKYGYNAFTKA
jgi:hypothetical protein